jgi:tetrahydromethanopterin S-methyltransferase subunit G
MTAFFVNVLLQVLENEKVQQMIRVLFDDAIAVFKQDVDSRLDELEKKVLDKVNALPAEILGDASKDVGILLHEITGTKDDIAGAVKTQVSPLFKPIVDVLGNLPGGGILGSIFGK